jgi:hypothetical protein
MNKYRKVISLKEFKARCEAKNIPFTTKLWNRYIDREWAILEEELQIPLDK